MVAPTGSIGFASRSGLGRALGFAAFRSDLGEVLFVVHSVLAFSLAALIMRRFWRISLLRRSTLCSDDVSPRFIAIAVIQISYESSSQWWDVGCIPFSSR
jgi:hypothetical protein